MYGLTFGALGRDHQSIVWCLRAFAGYVAVLRGRILDVEPLRRWFVVETLYTLARAYTTLDDGAVKAVHYLTVAKNLALAAGEEHMDFPQTIEVGQTSVHFHNTVYMGRHILISNLSRERCCHLANTTKFKFTSYLVEFPMVKNPV